MDSLFLKPKSMTVGELVEILKKFPKNTGIDIEIDDGESYGRTSFSSFDIGIEYLSNARSLTITAGNNYNYT